MTLPILKGSDPITIDNLVMVIYGQPGVGKTSLSFTAESPLLIDFDKGAHRSAFRQDTVPVTTWADLEGMTAEDLAPYNTVAIDTIGRCLDALSLEIIRTNPKMGQSDGSLTLKGYGSLKARFSAYLSKMRSYGKDIILVAHDKEDKRGDDMIIRPDVTGGSYAELFKSADAVGYAHVVNGKRVLHFSPTDDFVAKNPAGFEPLPIPNFHQEPGFMAGVITQIKDQVGSVSDESKKVAEQVRELGEEIAKAKTAKDFNNLLVNVMEQPKPVMIPAKHLLWQAAKAAGVAYDKARECFVKEEGDDNASERNAA